MTVIFSQVPLYYLDHLDPATFKRLHRDLIALSWRSSEAQAANTMQKLNQWSTYRDFYRVQRHMFERYADLSLLIEIFSNLERSEVVLNISYHEADDLNPFWVRDDICDLSRLLCAAEIPKVSQSARLYHIAVVARKTV